MNHTRTKAHRNRIATAFVLMVLILNVSASVAQTDADLVQSKGFHTDRNYFSPEPFEHFDAVSGNLVLTFTDLVLPEMPAASCGSNGSTTTSTQ